MRKTLEELMAEGGTYKTNGSVIVKYGYSTYNVWTKQSDGLYKNVSVIRDIKNCPTTTLNW